MLVSELMHPHPVTVQKDTAQATAVKLLDSLDVRHLPVLDGTELVGMLSDRDVAPLALRLGEDTGSQPVSSIMTADVATVAPNASAADAANAIAENRVGALPVVRDGRTLVGIVSYVDLLEALADVS